MNWWMSGPAEMRGTCTLVIFVDDSLWRRTWHDFSMVPLGVTIFTDTSCDTCESALLWIYAHTRSSMLP